MTSTLWIDIETRSRVDLKKTGVYRYVECPDFMILMASWSTDGETVQSSFGHDEIAEIPGLWDVSVTKVAHNAQFERVCFSKLYGLSGEYLDPEPYRDTQAIAAELGLPQSLGKLAKAVGAEEKDEAGTRLINLFCKPNRKGEWNGPDTHPMEWLDFIAYCEQDTATLIDVDRQLELLGGWPTETERRLFLADQRINDRGIAIDVPLAERAVVVGAANQAQQKERVRQLAGIDNPGSVPQMKAWAEEQGVPLTSMRAEAVEEALSGDLTPDQREVLELRQELALAAPAKFSAALDAHVGGRLRGTLKFFGAHTGRWAGRGTQVQNLPRASFKTDLEADTAILDLMLGEQLSSEDLKKLVRPMFTGPFAVVDYAAIEARVIAWLAGEQWALDAFFDGRDIYVETAERMGGLSRAQGKVAVLALGYNGGANSLRAMAGDGFYVDPHGNIVDGGTLRASRDGGGAADEVKEMTDDQLYERFIWPWREANSNIVKLWKLLESRMAPCGDVGPLLRWERDPNGHHRDRLLRLPSGRAIAYRDCQRRKVRKWNDRKEKWEEREVITFASPGQYGRQDTYGGRLAENATQAVARDVLAEAIIRLEDAGYRVVAHVHDEILVETEDDWHDVQRIMVQSPDWATGLPIDGEGFNTYRYKKG